MKIKYLSYLFLFFFFAKNEIQAQDSCGLQISILTCGVGEELYSSYGHSAVRVIDSCNHSDIVYNYGTFNFGDPDFILKFTRGKLPYYLSVTDLASFMDEYIVDKRSVSEQVLNLNQTDAKAVEEFLKNNLKEENKYYKYDFLYDNCTTRIRDMLDTLFKGRINFPNIISNDSVSFRTILNHYERNLHWTRTGINLLMSNEVDRKMKSYESMFLPDYLLKGLSVATLDGTKLVRGTRQLLQGAPVAKDQPNIPRICFWVLLLVIFLFSSSKKMQTPLMYFDVLFFLVLGLLGWMMLFMWFGTDHKVCGWNLNLLWAFPLHVVFAFMIPRHSKNISRYAKNATWLLIGAIVYNYFAEQKYIVEITPIIILILLRLSYYSRQKQYLSA